MRNKVVLWAVLLCVVLITLFLNQPRKGIVIEERPTLATQVKVDNQYEVQEKISTQKISEQDIIRDIILVYSEGVSEETAEEWALIIKQNANKHGIDPIWITAMVYHESRFDPYTESKCGARGLMQLMPGTARAMGVEDIDSLYIPSVNIGTGVKYLAYLKNKWDVDLNMATIAYNQGESVFKRGYSTNYLDVIRGYHTEMSQLHEF